MDIIDRPIKAKMAKEYTLKKYLCGYCGKEFGAYVRKVEGYNPYGEEPKDNTSTQVQCPRCRNFLKTWKEGELYELKP